MRVFHDRCWLAEHGVMMHGDSMPSCDGRLIRAHLISRHVIRKAGGNPHDSRSWVWACGGANGLSGHHGMLDSARTLRIPRTDLPPTLIEFALELGLLWWIDRTYTGLERVRSRSDYDDDQHHDRGARP